MSSIKFVPCEDSEKLVGACFDYICWDAEWHELFFDFWGAMVCVMAKQHGC